MVKANVDKILDVLKERKTSTVAELSHRLAIPKDDIEKSASYLEEDGIVKMQRNFSNTVITLIKSPDELPKQDVRQPQPIQSAVPVPQAEPVKFEPLQPGQQSPLPPPPPPQSGPNITIQLVQPQTPQQPTQPYPQAPGPAPQPPAPYAAQPPRPLQAPPQQQPQRQEQFPFLMDSNQASPFEKVNITNTLQVMSPVQDFTPKMDFNADPINAGPDFDLSAPSPFGSSQVVPSGPEPEIKSTFDYREDQSPKEESFPDFVETEMDRIDFLSDTLEKDITQHNYKDLNVRYRKLYDLYQNAGSLSPNERAMMGDKINELFRRIKRIYLIEEDAL